MSWDVEILRPDDLVVLRVTVHGLSLDTSERASPVLRHDDKEQPGYLVYGFPAQSFAEESYFEAEGEAQTAPTPDPGATRGRIAGGSRLAFRVPPGVSVPYTIAGLLDWAAFEPSLAPIARITGNPVGLLRPPAIVPPTATETAIELPWRLVISPGPAARWQHRIRADTAAQRTSLWTTRLVHDEDGAPTDPAAGSGGPIRAIWSPDHATAGPGDGGGLQTTSLTADDRRDLVDLTSRFPGTYVLGDASANAGRRDAGLPAEARHLALSALGGFLDASGRWDVAGIDLTSWTHRATLGRDQFVQVTYRGRLFPFMHRATLVVITERRFETAPNGSGPVAPLRKFKRIIVDEPEVTYGGADHPYAGREMPLGRVRIDLGLTPKLDPTLRDNPSADASALPQSFGSRSQEIWVKGQPFLFPCTAHDRAGNPVGFGAPLIFVAESDIPRTLEDIAALYRGYPAARTNGAPVRVADFGSTAETAVFGSIDFAFDVDIGTGPVGCLPKLLRFRVRSPSIEALTGQIATPLLSFDPGYLAGGLDAAVGLFARVEDSLGVGFSADQAGGIAAPSLDVRGFSAGFGPVAGDVATAAAGSFDAAGAFGDTKILGVIPIADLLANLGLGDGAPRIVTAPEPPGVPERIVTRMIWDAPVKTEVLTLKPGGSTRLVVNVTVVKPIADPVAAPATTVEGALNDFALELFGVLRINFDRFGFRAVSGAAPEVDVELDPGEPFRFLGALAFVEKVSSLIPPGLFGDSGPRLIVSPAGIAVGFALPVPPVAFGVFSVRNIAVSTDLSLPFDTGQPSFAVGFSSRENPFQLAVTIFGGGGFVRVELDPGGVRVLEVMFEFGGMFALDVGVASGSVHVLAGIYIGLRGEESELTGYVRVGGEVRILAVVSISIEFVLSLSYLPAPKQARGVAEVTVSVTVAFVSKSVSFSVERTFEAGSRHLGIAEAMSKADWAEYAEAFA